MQDWQELRREVFTDGSEFQTLEQSYRTTVEIMEAANQVIRTINDGRLVIAKPVIRHGPPVQIVKVKDRNELAGILGERIREARRDGYQSIAVIAKSLEECKALHAKLKHEPEPPQVITGKEAEYKSGIILVPSYLAKGLEFDIVLIADAGAGIYRESELDAKLLYVAMTRPLHKLFIYYQGELSPLLKEVVK
jgi:DNA helicase-2/ATP-dependent DNA helicase PcrA